MVQSSRRTNHSRKGLSLLEVLLSIALLGTALAIIFQLVSIGLRSAEQARLQTQGAILADTKMAEIASGVLGLDSASGGVIEEAPEWSYAVLIEDSDQLGLLVVTLTVEQNSVANPISMSVVRFMPDPEYDPNELE